MPKRRRQLLLLDALRERETRDEPFTLDELVEVTGYKLSSLKTYFAKRLRDVLVFEADDGRYEARGALEMGDEAFLRLLDQTRGAPSAEESLFGTLIQQSREHLELALTFYHRPSFTCRAWTFCHHMGTAWELLLVAEVVDMEGREGLDALDAFDDRLVHLLERTSIPNDDPVARNLRALSSMRRLPPHLPLDALLQPLSHMFQATVLNYASRHRAVVGASAPIGGLGWVLVEGDDVDWVALEQLHGAAAGRTLRDLRDRLAVEEQDISSPRFSVPPGYRWQLAPGAPQDEELTLEPDEDDEPLATSGQQASLPFTAAHPPEDEAPSLEAEVELTPTPDLPEAHHPEVPPEPVAPGSMPDMAALLRAAYGSLDVEDQRLLRARVDEGASIERLEREHHATAEVIKARLGAILAHLQAIYGAEAARLTTSLMGELSQAGGLIHRERACALGGERDLRRLTLGLAIAGASHVRRWREAFLTSLPLAELGARLSQLGDELRAQREAKLPTPRAMALCSEVAGLNLPRPDFDRLLEVAFLMEIGPDDRVIIRRTRADRLIKLMEAEARPMHFVEILDTYARTFPSDHGGEEGDEDGASRGLEAALVAILRGHEDIYVTGRDTWVHRAGLPVPPSRLEEIVAWCVEFMEGMSGAITPQRLLGELDRVGKDREGVSAALLRDALARHSDVVTFQNTHLLAHVDSFREQGATLDEWLERILKEHAEPLTLPRIIELLPEGIHYHRTAVHAVLLTSPWAISLGRGRFDHIDCLGLSRERRRLLIDTAVASLPEDGSPVSCRALLDEVNPLEPTLGGGHRTQALAVLWGLLHKDERAQCGPGGCVARSRDEGARRILETALIEVLEDLEVAHIRTLRMELTARYGHGGMESAFRALLSDCVERGLIKRLPDHRYALTSRS